MPTIHRAQSVEELLVYHELANILHRSRHRGDAAYCASDARLAEVVLDHFKERRWQIVKEETTT